ncbi:MAG TPA: hypothetical protein V6D11_23025 [Waterburya sp.]
MVQAHKLICPYSSFRVSEVQVFVGAHRRAPFVVYFIKLQIAVSCIRRITQMAGGRGDAILLGDYLSQSNNTISLLQGRDTKRDFDSFCIHDRIGRLT